MIQCDAPRLVLPRAFSPRTQFRGEGQDPVLPWAPAFAGVAKFLNSSTAASAWIWLASRPESRADMNGGKAIVDIVAPRRLLNF
jgi:hypothetical protein